MSKALFELTALAALSFLVLPNSSWETGDTEILISFWKPPTAGLVSASCCAKSLQGHLKEKFNLMEH